MIKQALTAVQGYSREAYLLEDLYTTPKNSPASSTINYLRCKKIEGDWLGT